MSGIVERLNRTLSDLSGDDDALFNEIHEQRQAARAEIERLRNVLAHIGTEDADMIVPDHLFSVMSPKDLYEAGLMDGAVAVREAVKRSARAALSPAPSEGGDDE